jgi:hypothetical protein
MVDLDQLEHAVEFVSFDGGEVNQALLNRETGEIFFDSMYNDRDEDYPEDADDSTKYISIPNQKDLELGMRLRLDFIRKHANHLYDQAWDISRQRKAYRRIRDLIEEAGLLDTWHTFEQAAIREAVKNWCAENGIEISTKE